MLPTTAFIAAALADTIALEEMFERSGVVAEVEFIGWETRPAWVADVGGAESYVPERRWSRVRVKEDWGNAYIANRMSLVAIDGLHLSTIGSPEDVYTGIGSSD